ncbi:uncharacterized protein LOC124439016 isoform X2 [Xenia sp. Carnegie-2017]|uniref:uncharacterized protein LOC124439016 isoform X2 n=1 Tax=Xenia sp. Carnegie-2017 TaxID=2897299 RepID=UPI001F04146B|nr:uncharacterized protein LOC124439016 isoform X2 [Xenia sp. Carnegie-2017]
MPQAIALYPFQGSTEYDLSVKKNEILDVVSDNEEVFWMVRNRYGQTGMVPVTHLAAPIFDKSIKILSRGRTITAHESKGKNILSVSKGQKVTIFDKSGNYWWFVGFQGQTGYLPKDIIKELKAPSEKHESDLQKFAIQDITPSKALCEEETDVLLLFQKPLPTKGQYFIIFKGKCNKTKVLAERLNDFILKISTPKYFPAEKTSIIICHKQSESHKQLISLCVEFEFESITDVVERVLHAKSVPVDVPRRLYEILGKYMEAHDITEKRNETFLTENNYTTFEKTIDMEDYVYEDIDEEPEYSSNNTEVFKDKFLDEDYNIRDDIHDILKNFSWICGAYGIVSPNKNFAFEHLYITVDNQKNYPESILTKEIDDIFGWEASNYIELKFMPKKHQRFDHYLTPVLKIVRCHSMVTFTFKITIVLAVL